MFRDQTRPTISWSSSGLCFLPFLPVLRHLLSIRGNNSWQRCWTQLPSLQGMAQRRHSSVLELGVSEAVSKSENYPPQASANAVLSRSTFQKRPDQSGLESRSHVSKSPALFCTLRGSRMFSNRIYFLRVLKKVKTSHYETTHRCSKDLLIESCWMKNTRAKEEN